MRTIAKLTILPVGLLALACGGQNTDEAALSEELRADLAIAAAADLELASSLHGGDAQVVSAIERVPTSSPVRARTPRKPRPRTPAPAPEPEATPAPVPVDEVAEELDVVAEAPAPSDMPVATRPVPVPYPSGGGTAGGSGRGADAGDIGEVVGTVIGVVIRGGGVGEDHCEIHDRRRGRGGSIASVGGILINSRIPVTRPGTFPRY